MKKIQKRNKKYEDFNPDKIKNAVMKAGAACGYDFEHHGLLIAKNIADIIYNSTCTYTVEEIQDMVEIELYETAHAPEVAKAYILYRAKRNEAREKEKSLKDGFYTRVLNREKENQRANANMNELSVSGVMQSASEEVWKELALEEFMPKDIADLHRNGELYQHDISRWALGESNCLNMSLRYPFTHGFKLRNSELRPPSRFSTACQLAAVIMQVASINQYGGIALASIDSDLAPFAGKSYQKISEKFKNNPEYIEREYQEELKQGAEALIHNLSSLQSRSGGTVLAPSISDNT